MPSGRRDRGVVRVCRTLSLKPTQFAVGRLEVEHALRGLRGNGRLRERAIKGHVVPVAVSPDGERYVLEQHGFVLAALLARVKSVRVDVRADYSGRRMSRASFWKALGRKGWLCLYDQFGDGPREPLYLPGSMGALSDDPYRSLVWMVRKAGGCGNGDGSEEPFLWAEFFRRRGLLEGRERRDLEKALPAALRYARSAAARGLPGYRGRAGGTARPAAGAPRVFDGQTRPPEAALDEGAAESFRAVQPPGFRDNPRSSIEAALSDPDVADSEGGE